MNLCEARPRVRVPAFVRSSAIPAAGWSHWAVPSRQFVPAGRVSLYCKARLSCSLTPHPALCPSREEGVAVGVLAGWIGRAAFSRPSDWPASSAASDVRFAWVARRAPSPLKGERAGVRGEDDRKLPCNISRRACAGLRGRFGLEDESPPGVIDDGPEVAQSFNADVPGQPFAGGGALLKEVRLRPLDAQPPEL